MDTDERGIESWKNNLILLGNVFKKLLPLRSEIRIMFQPILLNSQTKDSAGYMCPPVPPAVIMIVFFEEYFKELGLFLNNINFPFSCTCQ